MNSKYLIFAGMGMELVGIILACLYIGQTLDKQFGFQGLMMAGLTMLGLAGWITHIVVLSKAIERQDQVTSNKKNDQ